MISYKVGILGNTPHGWQLLLEQEGLSYVVNPIDPSVTEFTVLIVSDEHDFDVLKITARYLSAGGAVICSSKVFSALSGVQYADVFVKYLIEDQHSKYFDAGMIDLGVKASLMQNANEMRTSNGRHAIFNGQYSGGKIVVLPFDVGEIVFDKRSVTKSFYAKCNRLPYEHVARISKGSLLKLISRTLEILHHQRGLPYIHKWYYPNDSQTVFAWRIDTDHATQQEIKKLYDIISIYKIPATWFVDVKSQKNFLTIFKEMVGQEIGIHCYEHEAHDNYTWNLQNILQATDAFKMNGMEAEGFAATFGKWNDSLAKVIDEMGFVYSSEFSYDYDNVPSYPFLDNNFVRSLQIPVHPISIGNLRRQGFNESAMIEYYKYVMERKISYQEPLFFYHHPKNNHETVLKSIFDFVNQRNIKKIRMVDYARWWKNRCDKRIDLTLEQNQLSINDTQQQDDVWLHCTRQDGMEAFVQAKSDINISELLWIKRPKPPPLPEDVNRVYKFNPWIILQTIEDKTIGKIKSL
jgi:hypothetical protein